MRTEALAAPKLLTIWSASQSFAAARKFLPNQPAEKVYKNTQIFAFVRKYIKKNILTCHNRTPMTRPSVV
jgi:hypothetical protein